jgi:hypothetical protein
MESVTNRYVDFGKIQFSSNHEQLHMLSMVPSSEWRGLFTVTVVHFAEKPFFDNKACQSKWSTSSMCHPQTSELQQPNDPAEARKLTRREADTKSPG